MNNMRRSSVVGRVISLVDFIMAKSLQISSGMTLAGASETKWAKYFIIGNNEANYRVQS